MAITAIITPRSPTILSISAGDVDLFPSDNDVMLMAESDRCQLTRCGVLDERTIAKALTDIGLDVDVDSRQGFRV